MASTNKTTNYELSQYVGTDKPTYLGDYNSDMSKIDTAIHNNATAITGVGGDISLIQGNIGTMSNLDTTDKSSLVNAINEVNTKSNNNATNTGTLSNLETENKTTIVNAINELVEKFNLTDFETFENADVTKTNGLSIASGQFRVATNNDGSIFKIYDTVLIATPNSGEGTIKFTTKIRPTSSLIINGVGYTIYQNSSRQYIWAGTVDMAIATNGEVTFTFTKSFPTAEYQFVYLPPCIYFAKDFGDVPTPTPNA